MRDYKKLQKKLAKSLHQEENRLASELERVRSIIHALDGRSGRNPKIQRRSKRHRKPMSKATRLKIAKARKAAWSKKGKQEAAAA